MTCHVLCEDHTYIGGALALEKVGVVCLVIVGAGNLSNLREILWRVTVLSLSFSDTSHILLGSSV